MPSDTRMSREAEPISKPDEFEEELVIRLISVHGDVRDMDEVIDEILSKKDSKDRRFARG